VSGTQASVAQAEKQLDSAKARVAQARPTTPRRRPIWSATGAGGKDVISKQQWDAAWRGDAPRPRWRTQTPGSSAADGVRVAHEHEASAQAMLKYAETGPQQGGTERARQTGAGQVAEAQRNWTRQN